MAASELLNPYRQVILLSGHTGHGKSTALMSIDRCCKIDTEGGLTEMALKYGVDPDSPEFPFRVRDFGQHREIVDTLVEDAKTGKRQYEMVAIDTVDTLAGSAYSMLGNYILDEFNAGKDESKRLEFMASFGQGGAGWGRLTELATREVVHRLLAAGYGLVFVVHLSKKLFMDPEGNTRQTIRRNLTPKVDEPIGNLATTAFQIERRFRKVPTFTEKLIAGTMKKVEGPPKEEWYFVATAEGEGEGLKKRLTSKSSFEFDAPGQGPNTFWNVFKADFEESVRPIRERLGGSK